METDFESADFLYLTLEPEEVAKAAGPDGAPTMVESPQVLKFLDDATRVVLGVLERAGIPAKDGGREIEGDDYEKWMSAKIIVPAEYFEKAVDLAYEWAQRPRPLPSRTASGKTLIKLLVP